jgi:hypothetical protein
LFVVHNGCWTEDDMIRCNRITLLVTDLFLGRVKIKRREFRRFHGCPDVCGEFQYTKLGNS